jgi:peptidyl-prolyl cis-trans isomerase D
MLNQMRRGVTNLFTKLLLGLLVIAFAVWGIGDIAFRSNQTGGPIATVGKTQLTAEEFRAAYEDESQSVARRLGRKLTPEQAKLLGIHTRALARLIGFASLDLGARDLHVTATDNVVASVVRGDPAFQGLTGQFDRQKFREQLSKLGYRSENQYIQERKRDILREQLTETVGTGFVPSAPLIEAMHRFKEEKRNVEYFTPDFDKLVKVPEPDDASLNSYYEQNKRQYIAPESRKANVLLLRREVGLASVKVTDEELKTAYEAAKESYNVPEKRRVWQMSFSEMAAAEKAYAELSKAKNFDETATKLGFPPKEIDLGFLTRPEMIDPKIADATFALKKNELSKPVQGQFSIALVRVTEIEGGKQKTFDEVKGELKERLASDRVGQILATLHDEAEAERAKGRPLKEIADQLKIPFKEVPDISRTGRTSDGALAIDHADSGRIAEAIFEAAPGIETEALDLTDGGYAWFELVSVTPERQRTLEEAKADVKKNYLEGERRKAVEAFAAKQVERIKGGEKVEVVAKALGAKLEKAEGLKRGATPPAFTPIAFGEIFALQKGGASSSTSADGKSRTIFRVAEITPAAPPTKEQITVLGADLTKQLRIDALEQYVAGLRTRYGYTVNEKALAQAMGPRASTPVEADE